MTVKERITSNRKVALLTAAAICGILYMVFKAFVSSSSDIDVSSYAELTSLSKQSCSGAVVLREAVQAGPVSGLEFWKLRSRLSDLAEVQAASAIRPDSSGTKATCA